MGENKKMKIKKIHIKEYVIDEINTKEIKTINGKYKIHGGDRYDLCVRRYAFT